MADKNELIVKKVAVAVGTLKWGVYELLEHGATLRALVESEALAKRIADMLRGSE